MTFKPAHKQDNPDLKPGQTVYEFDRYPYLKSGSIAEPPAKQRLTFVEWAKQHEVNGQRLALYHTSDAEWKFMENIWNAAQENCK